MYRVYTQCKYSRILFGMNAQEGGYNGLGGRALIINRKCAEFILHPERAYTYISQNTKQNNKNKKTNNNRTNKQQTTKKN